MGRAELLLTYTVGLIFCVNMTHLTVGPYLRHVAFETDACSDRLFDGLCYSLIWMR